MKKYFLSIVIPVYNEEESLPELVDGIGKALSANYEFEYIFIDDGSTDGTFEQLLKLKQKNSSVFTVIRLRKNSGKSTALSAGFREAKGDIIVTMDADLQDEPGEIRKMVALIDDGQDFVVGWRSRRQDSHGKVRQSYIFNIVVSAIAGIHLHDMNSGLKVFRKKVTDEIDVYGELHRYIPVLAHMKGFRVTETEVVHHPRKFGVSKFSGKRIYRAAFDLVTTFFLTAFRHSPLQVFGPVGIGMFVCGVLPLIWLSYLHFTGISIGDRPLLLLGILLVLSGVQIFSVGLLGELITSTQISKRTYPVAETVR